MLLALIVWIGGIVFFSAVQAPETAHVLGATNPVFGEIISRSLSILHYFGFGCGILYLLASTTEKQLDRVFERSRATARVLVLLMLVVTAFSQFFVSRRMHAIHVANPQYEQLAGNDAVRVQFERLHQYSVGAEGVVLLLGLGVVILTARRFA